MSTAASQALVQKLYVAYYGRPADPAGLEAWALAIDANKGQVSTAIVNAFGASAESTALFGNMSTSQKVNAIYKQLFGRDAEPAGLLAWASAIDGGRVSAAGAALEILNGAAGDDKTTINNKLSAAAAFTAALDTTAEITAYSGDTVANAARSFLAGVTTAAPSTDAVNTAVASVTNTSGSGSNEAGKSYVLTTNQDVLAGTNSGDFFRAVAGNASGTQDQTTLNSSDIIDGGAGSDALIVNLVGGDYKGGARIKNVETLQIGTNDTAARVFDYNVNAGSNEVTEVTTIVADQINVGEQLIVNNITPTATGGVLPTLKWDNEAGSVAGTIAATFREAGVAGATTQLNVVLDDVNNGAINLGGKIETIKITSQGSSANTLANSINADGSPVVDLISASEDGVNNNGSLTKVIIDGAQNFGAVAGVVATAGANQGLTNRAVGADGGFVNETPVTGSNLISVAATVTEIDASAATGNVNVRFTPRVNGAEVNQVFKGGEGSDYVEFEVGNVNATGGKGNDTFAFLNNQFNSTFTTLDTIAGGEGSDTVQLGVNGRGVYNVDWTEFNNKTGVDTLDLRGAQNNVTLADSFVASADAGLTVRTDKIVQTSTSSVANPTGGSTAEDNAITTLNLTKLAANRALTFEGGSGSDRLIGNEASITSAAVLKGGTNVANNGGAQAVAGDYDTLTVVDSAVLSRGDLSNISGFEGLALVKTDTTAARTFSIELTEAFLLANTGATNSGATDINDTVFAITTGAAGGSNVLTGVDRVSIDVTDLFNTTNGTYKTTLAGRTVDINGLIAAVGAANVTVVYNGTSTTLAAAPAAVQAAVTNLGTNSPQVIGSAGLVAGSGGGSGAGAAGGAVAAAGNTFTLTTAGAVLATGTAPTNATQTNTGNTLVGLTANQDIINGLSFTTATIADGTAGDADQYNVNVIGAIAPTAVSGIENINLTLNAGGNFAATNVVTAANQFINVVTGTGIVSALTAAHNVNINAGAAGTVTLQSAAANASGNADFTVSVGGTTTQTLSFVDNTAGAATALAGAGEVVTITAASAASLSGVTMGAAALALAGAGNLNLGTVTGAVTQTSTATGNTTATYATAAANVTTNTGADNLTFTAAGAQQVTTGTGADVLTAGTAGGAATVLTVNDWANGTDSMSIFAGARANIAMTTTGTFAPSNITNNGILGITGTAGNDVISGTAGRDIVTGGVGIDSITLGGGSDSLVFAAGDAAYGTVTLAQGAVVRTNVTNWTIAAADTVVGAEVITGFSTTDASGAQITLGNVNVAADANGTLIDNEYAIVQGTYTAATQSFAVGAGLNTGADSLLVWDADSTAGINIQTVVLVGYNSTAEGFLGAVAAGVITM